MDAIGLLLEQVEKQLPRSRVELRKLKTAMASRAGSSLIRNDALLERYRQDLTSGLRCPNERLENILTLNGIRSQSGIATITVMTQPHACPGQCVYCPTQPRSPKSYLPNEPAVMRALRNGYDPYRQVYKRLEALYETGHPTDKIELIIKGGTWSFYPEAYQDDFIQRCVEAANDFASGCNCPQTMIHGREPDTPPTLEMTQRLNETAKCRIIGITIETRPDYVDETEICRLRKLGVTRVELGVQSLDESVLRRILRGHGTREVQHSTQLLKDFGFKVAYHMMPNLPGATVKTDLDSARLLFDEPAYRPDAIKLYPCVVIETAELYDWWKEGLYTTYDDNTLIELLIQIKQMVPPYVRIERIVRDVPSNSITAGCRMTNLREEIHAQMQNRKLRCQCIRCRQIRDSAEGAFKLIKRTYAASNGLEVFLSFEDPLSNRLACLLRLRLPNTKHQNRMRLIPALDGAGLIRELHSYGQHLPLHEHREQAIQHRGFGSRLLKEAERLAKEEFGLRRIAVIAGVGVREYYRRFGYELQDTYMVKPLA